MSGIKYLLDTNIVIGLLKAHPDTVALLQVYPNLLEQCAASQITRMELLGFPKNDAESIKHILAFLEYCPVLLINEDVEKTAIELRRTGRFKLPDAIIAATAHLNKLKLVTLDERLDKAFNAYQTGDI